MFNGSTPESLLARADSKDPANTCRGITGNGSPCRKGLAKLPNSSSSLRPRSASSPEAYCHLHRNQATPATTPAVTPQGKHHNTLQGRNSVDSLVGRLGILEIEQKKQERRKRRQSGLESQPAQDNGFVATPSDYQSKPQSPSLLRLLCSICVGGLDAEPARPPRPTNVPPRRRQSAQIPPNMKQNQHRPAGPKPEMSQRLSRKSSRTGISLIPGTTNPDVAMLLRKELEKPVSDGDEAGFIYMFWLVPEAASAEPASEVARDLLAPSSRPQSGRRRASDVLKTVASSTNQTSDKKTMLLKIGRAANVHRRMIQWQNQCGYNISLIRFYPYHPTTQDGEAEKPKTPVKTPNVHKVERLIHLELHERKVTNAGKCKACGREHKEWFEVDASREGVQQLDEVIRRWVDWNVENGS